MDVNIKFLTKVHFKLIYLQPCTTKMEKNRGHFATLSQDGSREGFGKDLGRIWGGFCKDLERFREDFQWNLGRFSIEISKDF